MYLYFLYSHYSLVIVYILVLKHLHLT